MGWQARGAQQEAQVAMLREALDGFLSCDPSFKHVTIDRLEKMEQTKLVPIVLKARKAMDATESTAAEFVKQIESEALERAAQGFDSLPPEKHFAECVARALREMKG